jgi:predicted DNA-binding transcriptional regulator YafY
VRRRRDAIVQELRLNGCLTVRELASRLRVSTSTINRDLARLRAEGVPVGRCTGGYTITGQEPIKRAIDRALLERRVLRIEYRDPKGERTTRDVEPSVVLGGRGGLWYLVAWCRLAGEVRVFRLERIGSAVVTDERYPDPGETWPLAVAEPDTGGRPGAAGSPAG